MAVALLLLVSTNTAAWLGGHLVPARWRLALDRDATLWDHQRIFGQHKTWAGLIAGVLACGLVAMLLRRPFLLGAAFGALSLAGDCASSFMKRRLKLLPGCEVPLLDQVPEALIPLLVLAHPLGLSALAGVAVVAAFVLLDLAVAKLRHSRDVA